MCVGCHEVLRVVCQEGETAQEEWRSGKDGEELVKRSRELRSGLVELEGGMKVEDEGDDVLW